MVFENSYHIRDEEVLSTVQTVPIVFTVPFATITLKKAVSAIPMGFKCETWYNCLRCKFEILQTNVSVCQFLPTANTCRWSDILIIIC